MTRWHTHLGVVAALALAACKGGDEGTAGDPTGSATDTGPTTQTTTNDVITESGTTGPDASDTSNGPNPSTPTTGDPDPSTTAGPTSTTAGPTSEPDTTDPSTDPDTTNGETGTTNTTDPTDTDGDDSTLCASQAEGRYFPADAWFYEDVSNAPVAADSQAITEWMVDHYGPGGWGTGEMRIDFSIVAIDAPAGTMKRDFMEADGFYYEPDCDLAPVPLPAGGYVEDYPQDPPDPNDPWAGYDCSGFADDADCHIIVVSRSEQRLYEIYHATIDDSDTFYAGCEAVWDTSSAPTADGRGQQCTSADAAGFPIAPLLFSAEEVAAGEINHAIRFILPNDMIRAKKYVYPATHGTNTSGPITSIPYGGQMRLRADYPIQNLKPAAQVVARAMQKYGIYMADGGNIALTAQADVVSCATWADVDLDEDDLTDLLATDFEVIDRGPTMDVTYECDRTQITQ